MRVTIPRESLFSILDLSPLPVPVNQNAGRYEGDLCRACLNSSSLFSHSMLIVLSLSLSALDNDLTNADDNGKFSDYNRA